jgi:hypothetical protein
MLEWQISARKLPLWAQLDVRRQPDDYRIEIIERG